MQDHQTSRPWYVARLKPGASRRAPDRHGIAEWRVDETLAERSMRDEGFGCYLPRMKKGFRHHRTNEILVKAVPLFVGYCFVDAVAVGRVRAADCDGVAEILGERLDGRPWPVPATMVKSFMDAETNLDFDDTPEARQKRQEEGKNLRETITMMFPDGHGVRVSGYGHPLAGFYGEVSSVNGKGMVRVMMNLFRGKVPVEINHRDLEAA